ncbi:MAG: succinylglutamate desuccinylase/aspartoacylase family protein [Bacteroidota bacterium]
MIFNGVDIPRGETHKVEVNISRLPSRSPIDIYITIARAKQTGPVLLLMGGLHGDEINGVEIVRRIVEQNLHQPIRGTVICIPIINIYGFINFSRYVPDGKDVNRSFPGNKNGSLASRVAYYLTKDIIPKIDVGVDFHTGGADRSNFPQIRCMMNDAQNQKLAQAFNAPFTLHAKYRPKSLRQTAARQGKRILVYEGGESARFDENAIQQGINGTIRLMRYLGITDAEAPEPTYSNHLVSRSSWVRARTSGIFQCSVKNGVEVKKNQLMGYMTDPFGDFKEPIKSPATGYVIGLNNNPIHHQGDAIAHIGIV